MLTVLKARCVESGKLLCLDSRSGMLLPPASQAAVSSAPKPKQVHPLSPLVLVSDADLSKPRPCTARTGT